MQDPVTLTEIDWRDIANFRNIAVHAYFPVDWQNVWITATKDVPELSGIVMVIIEGEFSNEVDDPY